MIYDESHMSKILYFLCYHSNTIDNQSKSANRIIRNYEQRRLNKMINKAKNSCHGLEEGDEEYFKIKVKLTAMERHKMVYSTVLKYKILRIRSKISYMAYCQKLTINEMFLKTIRSSYIELHINANSKEDIEHMKQISHNFLEI